MTAPSEPPGPHGAHRAPLRLSGDDGISTRPGDARSVRADGPAAGAENREALDRLANGRSGGPEGADAESPLRLLLIEDNDDHAALFRAYAGTVPQRVPPRIEHVHQLEEGRSRLESGGVDAVLLDLNLPDSSGLDSVDAIRPHLRDAALVVLTSEDDRSIGMEAIARGAQDFLPKADMDGPNIHRALRYAIERNAQRLELEKTNETLNAFVRAASHDLKTPLRHIHGLSELLLQEIGDEIAPEHLNSLERIKASVLRLDHLLGSIRQFAESGTGSRGLTRFALREALDSVLEVLPDAQSACVCADLPHHVRADRDLVEIVLANLVGNALKYVRGDQATVHVSSQEEGEFVRIAVRDEGIGIEADQLEKIFQPGHRAVHRRDFEGSGFGLATCRRIVEAHRGRIHATSEVGRGTTVSFTLPLAAPED